jgi:hypothetical protein
MGWAEYDADLLDNIRKTKKFAVDVSMASDLASKMVMGDQSSPVKSVNKPAISGAAADPMCVSSVECSPAVTPKVPLWGIDHNNGGGAPPSIGPIPQLPGWATPQRPIALGPAASVSLQDRSLTSPSDTQLDGQDLRKVALRRVALLRNANTNNVSGGGGGSVERTGDEAGSPMALGGIHGGSNEFLPNGLASPAVSHRRSRLARTAQLRNPLPSPQIDMMATTPVRYRGNSGGGGNEYRDDSSSPDEFEEQQQNQYRQQRRTQR